MEEQYDALVARFNEFLVTFNAVTEGRAALASQVDTATT